MAITIQSLRNCRVRRKSLAQAAQRVLETEGAPHSSVTIVLADDELLHDLNLQFRGLDKPTDVLSFSHGDSPAVGNAHSGVRASREPDTSGVIAGLSHSKELGDVIISVDTARRQAKTSANTLESELCLLVVHGVLHLLGYDDETDEQIEVMRAKERQAGVRN